MEISKILMFSVVLFSLNINSSKAMESNNKMNIDCNKYATTYNKLNISKQADFKVYDNNNIDINNINVIQSQQSLIQRLELKINELLEKQNVFEKKISAENKILQEEIKEVKRDIGVSSVIFESVNNLSDNITKNTKQIQHIRKHLKNANDSISNQINTLTGITTHGFTSLISQESKRTNETQENNDNITYLIKLINMIFGIVPNNNVIQFASQNYVNNTNNIINNNIQEDYKENYEENYEVNNINNYNQ